MNIQNISKDLLASVTSIIEKKSVKEVDEPVAKGEKDFKDLHTKNVEVYTEKDFKPHTMYDPKTGKGYEAKTYDDHVRMDKMGYTHEKPEVKEVDEPTAKGEKDFKDLHTKNVKVHTESIEEATGKEIAAKMMKDKMLKPFASKVAKMKSVTAKDLDKMLPDYIVGGDISSLFEGADKDVKGDKEAYQKFFQGMLKKFGVKSPSELSADKEKEFYDAIDAGWKADDEKKESIEEMKEPFIVIDTADKNKVVGTASNEKGAERIIASSERPPISIKDKKTLKVVKSSKKQNVGFPMKEETLEEAIKFWKVTITKKAGKLFKGQTVDVKASNSAQAIKKGLKQMKADPMTVPSGSVDAELAESTELEESPTNALYRTTKIHLALRNSGLKPKEAQKVTDALKVIYGSSGDYKGSEVAVVVRAVMGDDSKGRKLADTTISQLHDLSQTPSQKKGFNESKSATGFDIYHKTFSGAMQHAYAFAKKKFGIEIDPKEIDDKVATGPRKPSSGKTNSYGLKALGGKKGIQVQVHNTGKSFELNVYKESVNEETLEERVRSMGVKERLEVFNSLKKGDKVRITYDSPIAQAYKRDGQLSFRNFTVTRNKTVVGKERVEKITLAKDDVRKGVKFFLYNRKGQVSMAIGDLAAVIVDMEKVENESTNESISESVIDDLKDIVAKKQDKKIQGVMVKVNTASAITKVYDKVNAKTKAIMDKANINRLIDAAYPKKS